MPRITPTDARVRGLRPRKTSYDTRDRKLTAFGVRVLPSGRKRFFVHCQHRGERVWKIVGDAGSMTVAEARSRASAMLAAIRRLSAALSAHAESRPLEVAVVRLLLLTGCRKGEILMLRWSDYREGRLFLRDGKTGTFFVPRPAESICVHARPYAA